MQKSLSYTPLTSDMREAAEEWIEFHSFEGLFSLGGANGPTAGLPGPQSLIFRGLRAQEEAGLKAESLGDTVLNSGTYLFRQATEDADFDLGRFLNDYLRDAWWEGRKISPPLAIRRVREDGKIALQLICPLQTEE